MSYDVIRICMERLGAGGSVRIPLPRGVGWVMMVLSLRGSRARRHREGSDGKILFLMGFRDSSIKKNHL